MYNGGKSVIEQHLSYTIHFILTIAAYNTHGKNI